MSRISKATMGPPFVAGTPARETTIFGAAYESAVSSTLIKAAISKPNITCIHDLPRSSRQLGLPVPEAGMVRRSDQEVNCKSEAGSALPFIYPSRECMAKDSSWFQQGMMIEARPSCVRRFTNQCCPLFSPPISTVPFSLSRGSLGMFHHGPPRRIPAGRRGG